MNFFQDQEEARRNTRVLVGLFMLAIMGMITQDLQFHDYGDEIFKPLVQ